MCHPCLRARRQLLGFETTERAREKSREGLMGKPRRIDKDDGAGARARGFLDSAERTFEAEAGGIAALIGAMRDGLGAPFVATVELIRAARGRIIVTGMGKSGHVGRKIAATFASTGTPSFFVHPGEASHGDLGM